MVREEGVKVDREPDYNILGMAWSMEITPTLGALAPAPSIGLAGWILM